MPDSEEIQRQRIYSSIEIIEYARSISLKAGVPIDKLEWDHNKEIIDRDAHNFRIYVGTEHIDIQISDEALTDYQGHVGTEKTEKSISDALMSFLPEPTPESE